MFSPSTLLLPLSVTQTRRKISIAALTTIIEDEDGFDLLAMSA